MKVLFIDYNYTEVPKVPVDNISTYAESLPETNGDRVIDAIWP